jgi:hypothetical protein
MKTLLLGFLALALVGCGASVSSTVTPGANLGRYRTYTFLTPPYRAGQPESPGEQELRTALRQDLAQKGLAEAQPGQTPDFHIAYHVKEQQKLDVDTVGYGFWGLGGGDVYTYTEGTIIVDFVDPQTKQVFWRGTASDVVDNPSSPKLSKIDAAVSKMVKRYPGMMATGERPTM